MANQWLTGSGVPSTGIGQVTDYYRDTASNLVYYRENAFTWTVVPAFTPNPDGIGTTWLHGDVPPLTGQGSDGDYFYEDTHKIVYRKEGATWVAKGSLDFIGIYGVQWGNGIGAPANTTPLNNLPAGSFYLDVATSDIYYKNNTLTWSNKGQLGIGSTGLDAIATAADRVQTGLDAVATAADRVQTGLDAVSTAADRVQTGLDAVSTAADRVQTGLDRTQTGADVVTAAAARDAALLSRGVFATTAKALSDGVINYSSLVAGTGGTNGTFAIGFSGGAGTGAAGYFTVAGGSITSITFTATGDSYTSAPTMSFSASSGLTGASATAVIGANVNSGEYFSVIASTSEDSLILYLNNAGVAVEQKRYPSSIYATLSTEPFYVNGQQVMYSVVDSAGRALAYIGMDGVIYGKLPVTASSGVALTRIADGSYTLKLDAAVIDPSYGAVDYLAAIVDSAGRKLFTVGLDGTIIGKLGVSASGGLSATQLSTGVYNFALDSAIIDTSYGGTDYLAAIVDSAGRILFSVGFDGTITGKLTVTEVITARGNRTDLDTRLSQNLTTYGMPKRYTWGEWFLRETRMRLRKRALSETAQLTIAMIGDSWTHAATRYSGVVASTLKTAFGDAGAGWTGFGWGFGGASSGWSGGNGSASSDMAIALSANWSTHYNSSVSPDIADIYTSTAAAKITATFSGSGNVSAVNLFYIAGGSGNIRYRWNAGAWTALDISAGAGLLTAALASVPTGTWTLEIENVSGTTTICGLDVQKTADGVRVHKLGGTGSASSSWTAVNAAYWQAGLTALAPNLVTILLGTNDQGASMSPATYRTNLQTMITRVKDALPFADIALIMPCENQRTSNTYEMSLYAKELYELAAINNCAYLDLQYVFGDTASQYAYGSARPWFAADLIHPDPATGGRVITDAVYRLLTTQ